MTTNCSFLIRAVESPSVVVTRTSRTTDTFSQSLERAYFEASEGAEGPVYHKVHFSVSQLETGDSIACKWEPELHELPSKAFQAQLSAQSLSVHNHKTPLVHKDCSLPLLRS
jgi:hypothetical protein